MTRPAKKTLRSSSEPRLSRTRQPESLSTEDWQAGLRRQFGREQPFVLERLGAEPEFVVGNPQSTLRYRVAMRGLERGDNYCSCPDFASNDLGTCKHIEFTLAKLARRDGEALARGLHPPYSEVYLRYAGVRRLRFRAGTWDPLESTCRHASLSIL